jgi:hypothetical protein
MFVCVLIIYKAAGECFTDVFSYLGYLLVERVVPRDVTRIKKAK